MKPSTSSGIALLAVCLALGLGCGHPTDLPPEPAASSDPSQKLPFNREPQSAGISPSRSLVPSVTRLPEGTLLTICLHRDLSSAAAHSGDSFAATLDAPIVIDGQTLVSRGAVLQGRVLDAKHSAGPRDPGYLRIALVSLRAGDKLFPIETSSLFAKGGSREDRSSALIGAGADRRKGALLSPAASAPEDVVLGAERRLSFRLTQKLDLQ
jgi:hypothetical protein